MASDIVGPPKPMPCPRCRAVVVAPHPESTAIIGLYECPLCRQDWTARFHGDEVTVTMTPQGGSEPTTTTTSLKGLNTGIIERLR